jgi:hypothetical protein
LRFLDEDWPNLLAGVNPPVPLALEWKILSTLAFLSSTPLVVATIWDYTPLLRRLYVAMVPSFLLQAQRKLIIALHGTFYSDT